MVKWQLSVAGQKTLPYFEIRPFEVLQGGGGRFGRSLALPPLRTAVLLRGAARAIVAASLSRSLGWRRTDPFPDVEKEIWLRVVP
jgi:hypothetical protein